MPDNVNNSKQQTANSKQQTANSKQQTANSSLNPISEESLKNKVARLYFDKYDCTDVLGKIDFCVTEENNQKTLFYETEKEYYLWAEAKKYKQKDLNELFVQLILTIGKDSKLRNSLPPKFLGAFDPEQIAFIQYSDIQTIFNQNDFNWNVSPSNHNTKEFRQLYDLVQKKLNQKKAVFWYSEEKELKDFIRKNFKKGKVGFAQIEITRNNFSAIYTRWLNEVKDSIDIDWDIAKQKGVLDADFYLADLLSKNNQAVKDNLFVLLKGNHYEYNRRKTDLGIQSLSVGFKDRQKAHNNFWQKYKRPPASKYHEYIINRRDLLVPQDIRERKGSYFTPQIWVQKSQEYLADVLGEDWQDEYYIWDCCAGTGNMENGLINKYRVWASTIDQSDVDIMKERAKNGANLLESHIFQMDFLNDSFKDKCPADLQEIINDPEKRKKLVIYINPPYGEGDSRIGKGRSGIAVSKIQAKYSDKMGYSKREMFIQFMTRIFFELSGCKLGQFSKLKFLMAPRFKQVLKTFDSKLQKVFLVPANTFDNVDGSFPIAFQIWDTNLTEPFTEINADVFDEDGNKLFQKKLINYDDKKVINDWVYTFIEPDKIKEKEISIANIIGVGSDFQNQTTVVIENPNKPWNHKFQWQITQNNLIQSSIYLAVRWAIKATWLNDRDQFLWPNEKWNEDKEFQSDCLAYTLFTGQNAISLKENNIVNHWIPFTEQEVQPKNGFASHFMTDYIKQHNIRFSGEAQAVLEAGKALWKYYHSQPDSDPNASYYDIREYFQGRNDKGKMNNKSGDETYNVLIYDLRQKMKVLQKKIIPKIYEYGFLLQ